MNNKTTLKKPRTEEEAWQMYNDAVEAIADDYMLVSGAVTELRAATENLVKQLEQLRIDQAAFEDDYDEELTTEHIVEALTQDNDELDKGEILEAFDPTDIAAKAAEHGYFVVNTCQSLALKEKLVDYVCREIYPLTADQDAYLFD